MGARRSSHRHHIHREAHMQIITTEPMDADLRALVGMQVSIAVTENHAKRNDFAAQVCVTGALQAHPTEPTSYRVVVDDHNFAYFKYEHVEAIVGPNSRGHYVVYVAPFERRQRP